MYSWNSSLQSKTISLGYEDIINFLFSIFIFQISSYIFLQFKETGNISRVSLELYYSKFQNKYFLICQFLNSALPSFNKLITYA